MNLELYKIFFWPLLIFISIAKPISDYFWMCRKPENNKGEIFFRKNLKPYMVMVISGLLFWAATCLTLKYIPAQYSHIALISILVFTIGFILITIISIKSILVVGLIIVTFANLLLVQLFQPLTKANDLVTLNNLLSNLISIFNYTTITTAAVGLVWQYSRHIREDKHGTISTMFYAICYILLNMFISFMYLFLPIITKIRSLA